MKAFLLLALVAFVAAATEDPCSKITEKDKCFANKACGWDTACVSCDRLSTEKTCTAAYGCGFWFEKADEANSETTANCKRCSELKVAPLGQCYRYTGCVVNTSCTDANAALDNACAGLTEQQCSFVNACDWTGKACKKTPLTCPDYESEAKCTAPCKWEENKCKNPDAQPACSTLEKPADCYPRIDCFWKGSLTATTGAVCAPRTELAAYCTGTGEACTNLEYATSAVQSYCVECDNTHTTEGCSTACVIDCSKATTSGECEPLAAKGCGWCKSTSSCQMTGTACDCAFESYDACKDKKYTKGDDTQGDCYWCTRTSTCVTDATTCDNADCKDRLPDACVSTLEAKDPKKCTKCAVNNYCTSTETKDNEDKCYNSCLKHADGVTKDTCESAADRAGKHCDYCAFGKTCGYTGECVSQCDAANVDKATCDSDATKCKWCTNSSFDYCDFTATECETKCDGLEEAKCTADKLSGLCQWCATNGNVVGKCSKKTDICKVDCTIQDEASCKANTAQCKWDDKAKPPVCKKNGAARIALSFIAVVVAFAVALF